MEGMALLSPSFLSLKKYRRAFTVLEVSFAVAVFSLFAVSSIYAITQANRFASNSRYKTLALAAAQQKIDQVMTSSWSTLNTPPTVLRTDSGVTAVSSNTVVNTADVQATTTETSLPLNNDTYNSATGLSSAFTNNDVQVLDQRVTVITKLTDCSGKTGKNSRLLRADVTVSYTYRGKSTSLSLSTLRISDDF